MAPNTKRVFYVRYLSSPLYAEILAQHAHLVCLG